VGGHHRRAAKIDLSAANETGQLKPFIAVATKMRPANGRTRPAGRIGANPNATMRGLGLGRGPRTSHPGSRRPASSAKHFDAQDGGMLRASLDVELVEEAKPCRNRRT
jgi:hypothetical protein